MEIGVLSEGLGELLAAGVERLGSAESIVELYRLHAQLEAVVTLATAAFDASQVWAADDARTATQWLATRCRVPKQVAGHRVSLGRKLRYLPECEKAWTAGDITDAQVTTIAGVRNPRTETALTRDEHLLVDQATTMRFDAFVRAVNYWAQLADPDGADDSDQARQTRRDVYLTQSYQGMWLGKMTLDPISGEIVGGELAKREHELFEADWAEARARLGREPTIADLGRTPGQRRADALVEMAIRSRTAPKDGIRPAPLFTALVGYETLHGRICELASTRTVIAPGTLVPWMLDAYIERAVFALDGRVECSRTARLFTGATRRAIQIRDRECTNEFCDRPAPECEVDHVIPYARGGPTIQVNGRCNCDFHNQLNEKRRPPPDPPPDEAA